jgi:Glycosyl hydrolases family 38 C-terminal domain/Glycosyl hydrolases family 38 C-terminal beta sandwich domain
VFEPVAGNYYPMTAAAYLRDEARGIQLSLLTDRSQGVASIRDGEIEAMIHRRILADDSRGVDEALNETRNGMTHYPTWTRIGDGIVVSGKHQLLLSRADMGMKELRTHMDQTYAPFQLFFGDPKSSISQDGREEVRPKPPVSSLSTERADVLSKAPLSGAENLNTGPEKCLGFTPLGYELPENVHILTLEQWSKGVLLLRLAHQFAMNEDPQLSTPVKVDIAALLKYWLPESIVEMSLSVNQYRSEMLAHKLHWDLSKGDQKKGTMATGTSTALGKEDVSTEKGNMNERQAQGQTSPAAAGSAVSSTAPGQDFMCVLQPMDVKTFLVQVKK